MKGIRVTRNRQNTRSFGKFWREIRRSCPDLPTVDASVLGLSSIPSLVPEHAAEHEDELSFITKKCAVAWSREMTLAFIGLYKSHEHLFHRVNIKKKSV